MGALKVCSSRLSCIVVPPLGGMSVFLRLQERHTHATHEIETVSGSAGAGGSGSVSFLGSGGADCPDSAVRASSAQ